MSTPKNENEELLKKKKSEGDREIKQKDEIAEEDLEKVRGGDYHPFFQPKNP